MLQEDLTTSIKTIYQKKQRNYLFHFIKAMNAGKNVS